MKLTKLTAKNKDGQIFLGDEVISKKEAKCLIRELKDAINESQNENAEKRFSLPKKVKKAANDYIAGVANSYDEHGWDYDHGGAICDWVGDYIPSFTGLDEKTLTDLFLYMLAKDDRMDLAVSLLSEYFVEKGVYSIDFIKDIMTKNAELAVVGWE